MKIRTRLLFWCVGLAFNGTSQAALIDRGGGLIYNDILNITWLADANYAKSNGYDVDGKMSWTSAMAWAATLSYFDSVRGVTYTDWRLPITEYISGVGPCLGGGCPGSEMGQLMYLEGGLSYTDSILSSPLLNSNFINMQADAYWLGIPYELRDDFAWKFETTAGGGQSGSGAANEFYAWAVRPGDVASPNSVPEPQTLSLLCLALAGMATIRHARK